MTEIILSLLENNEDSSNLTSEIGIFGEKVAVEHLGRQGYSLVAQNFTAPIGRNRKGVLITGEIDIIALDQNIVCFIEVKTRTSDSFGSPLTAIDLRKQRQIIRTAKIYRKTFDLRDHPFRYDAIGVVLTGKTAPKITHIESFWDERKFKKKTWLEEFAR